GTDSFTYTVSDGHGKTSTATVTVDVLKGLPLNSAPVATNDHAATDKNIATLISVLSNDTDANQDVLSIAGVNKAQHGSVSISGSKLLYTPTHDFVGSDSFAYTVSDGHGKTDTAIVTI